MSRLSDLNAEKNILCAMLQDNKIIFYVLEEISPVDFQHPAYKNIFIAAMVLLGDKNPFSQKDLADYLQQNSDTETLKVAEQLVGTAPELFSHDNVMSYCSKLRECSKLRKLRAVAQEMLRQLDEGEEGFNVLNDSMLGKILDLSENGLKPKFQPIPDRQDCFRLLHENITSTSEICMSILRAKAEFGDKLSIVFENVKR